jgi:uncharacterized protein YndB with AHSA1/START domain
MSARLDHRTFVITRDLPGSVGHAYRFWAEHDLKRLWNACHPDWHVLEDSFDFRVEGSERVVWRTPQGVAHAMFAHYLDIAERERIVYAYTMRTDGRIISSSLVTVEFAAHGDGTTMTFTEQGVFIDVKDGDTRESGTGVGFDRLHDVMASEAEPAR